MRQKVWYVFDDTQRMEAPEKSGPDEPPATETGSEGQSPAAPAAKNPALSFSCSMLVWGSGHLYSGAYGAGSLFMVAMLLFYSLPVAMLFFRDAVSRWVAGTGIPAAALVAGAMVYLLLGLVCWLANAVDAYYRTTRLRSELFRGVDNERWPLLGSLLFPGWGQFLNGQPMKGLFFLCWGGMGGLAGVFVSLIRYVWPVLKAGPAGYAFENCLVAALLLMPISLLMWLVSAYDAFISCKELFIEKIRHYPSAKKVRKRKVARHLVPRWNAILGLLLAISVGNQCFPKAYYLDSLEKIRVETANSQLEIIPGLIGKAIEFINR